MRQLGSKFEHERERNADLVRAFREQLILCKSIVLPELLERVVNSPSKRFWISEERALFVISTMLKGESLPIRREKKREMYGEIFRRVKKMMKENPDIGLQSAVGRVITQKAPKFYLTPESACVILSKIKNGHYR